MMKNKRLTAFICSALVLLFLSLITVGTTAGAPAAKSQQKITIAVAAEPDTLDPTTTRFSVTSAPISNNIFERLVDLTPDGRFVPGIASWTVSRDGKVVEFVLRKGIKFHSGDPLTTRDVEFSHNRALKTNPTHQRAMRNLDRFEIVDDYKCRFIFKIPDVLFIPTRSLAIVSKTYYDRVGENEFVSKPVGTGPYKFVEWKLGEYIDITANDSYWGTKPQVRQARFRFIKEDSTRVATLKSGEADIIMSTPYAMVKDVESAGFRTARLPTHPPTSIQFHNNNPDVPWYDKRVRLAIAYAIDGDSIVKNLFQGIPGRYARLAPGELGYDPTLKPYPYDPKKAKELLSQAGYSKGFEMPLYYFSGRVAGQKETAEAVALYLNAAGITCKVQGIDAPQMLDKVRAWHDDPKAVYVGLATVPMAHLPEPTEALSTGYYSKQRMAVYFNPKLDALIETIETTIDNKKRGELIKAAIKMIHDDVATIQIYTATDVYAMKPNVEFTLTKKNREPLMLIKDVRIKN
ncbi:MAG TPA: ABC transporter substrate-binding protein [Syntrophorhabdaceae bacterium]|nr:ABC transporter substrate-binding protein [Syntrophorhabdaceae bacterium]